MTPTMRKALYGLIPLVVAALTAYGIFTDNLGVLWGNVATLTVGFAFAASRATGDRFGDPEVRRALYVLVPAVVALIGGYFSVDVALWTSLAMAILGAALAGLNVDPDEQEHRRLPAQADRRRKGLLMRRNHRNHRRRGCLRRAQRPRRSRRGHLTQPNPEPRRQACAQSSPERTPT